MVSVVGKGGGILRQVCLKETNESEPLMTCRKARSDVETGIRTSIPREDWEAPDHCPIGVRHEGGVILIQALIRNVGSCRPDAKGEIRADSLRKGESTDACSTFA